MTTSWETKPLGEVCQFRGGGTPSKQRADFWNGSIPWVSPKDMKSVEISDSIDHITDSAIEGSATALIPSGSILLVVRSGILARTVPIGITTRDLTVNQDLKALVPGEELDPWFVYYALKSSEQSLLGTVTRGATVHRLSSEAVKNLPIPLPPLEEQKRIVAILDAAFADIDALAETTNVRLATAKRLFLSVLSDLYLGVGEAGGVTMVALGEFADHKLGKMLDKSKNRGTFKPYLRNANVRWFGFDLSDLSEMKIEEDERKRYEVRRGDLLICEGGYPGRCAIWQQTDEVYFQKAVHRVRFESDDLAPWVMYYLYFLDQTGKLSGSFSGTGIQHFTGQALHKFEVPLPEEGFRRAAIQRIERARQLIDESSKVIESKAERIVDLRQSLLHQAFSGQL